MLTQTCQTSERKYRVREERDFTIPVADGTKLNSFLFRPDADGKFPVILGVCAYSLGDQVAPVMPVGAGGGEWLEAEQWPLPQTRWTPFYLHEHGLLSEHEFWANEPPTVYIDSPYERGSALFLTPAMVEATDICGPMSLTLYASLRASQPTARQ